MTIKGKLIRDRSTKANELWWDEVLKAAKSYPKCNVRIFSRADPKARCSRPEKPGSRYCWQHDAIARRGKGGWKKEQ